VIKELTHFVLLSTSIKNHEDPRGVINKQEVEYIYDVLGLNRCNKVIISLQTTLLNTTNCIVEYYTKNKLGLKKDPGYLIDINHSHLTFSQDKKFLILNSI
jgi:hypothetical protein